MADLQIPARAVFAAARKAYDLALRSGEVAAARAAAPIIVAAELRRLADELYDGPQRWPASKVQLLRARADELDPPGDDQ